MTGTRTPEAERLLGLAAGYLLDNGVSGVSLSRLAKSIGSNNRMLLYYFASKDQLFTEAMRTAYRRFPALSGILPLLHGAGVFPSLLKDAWRSLRAPENLPYLTLFFEGYALVLRNPEQNPAYLAELRTDWPDELVRVFSGRGLAEDDSRQSALQLIALWRGMQLSLLAGAETAALDRAHDAAVDALFAAIP